MNILLLVTILFTNVISKTIPHADQINIISDGTVEIIRHNSSRIIIETTCSNNAPAKLQDYIRKRYKIETVTQSGLTTIIISKPKAYMIYKGKQIKEELSSVLYIPKDTYVK